MPSLRPTHGDLYGPAVAVALHAFRKEAAPIVSDFASRFYKSFRQSESLKSFLDMLSMEEHQELTLRQKAHLLMLIDPELEEHVHEEAARVVGRVHALVGVETTWLIGAYNVYQETLHATMSRISEDTQHLLHRVLSRRVLFDLQAQSIGYQQVESEFAAVLAEVQRCTLRAHSTSDLYHDVLAAICGMDGVLAATVARPGAGDELEIEAAGVLLAAEELWRMHWDLAASASMTGDSSLDAEEPAVRAWKSGQIIACDTFVHGGGNDTQRQLGRHLGIRSWAAIPLTDDTGQTISLITMYSKWPCFFRGDGRHIFLQQLQLTVGEAARRHSQGTLIPHARRQHYRSLIALRRMRMLYQPIISFRTGTLRKVEALGRLTEHDGSLLSPGAFLPALGNRDLLLLFEFGVEQACHDLRVWHESGDRISASLNMPPQGIEDSAYHEALFKALDRSGCDPSFIELEILEARESGEFRIRDNFLARLKDHGIKLVQDDLGAGHSSLLRMDSVPFDEVKIDQGLVLRAGQINPQRGFGFIYYLTQLVHELGAIVTVEGLENAGLIEAAAMLGADQGQGFGFARPMPADCIVPWSIGYTYAADPNYPRTAWGALAGYLLWDRQLRALDRWPDLVEKFLSSPSPLQRYLDYNVPTQGQLRRAFEKNLALALGGSTGQMYQLTRRLLIRALSEEGLRELTCAA